MASLEAKPVLNRELVSWFQGIKQSYGKTKIDLPQYTSSYTVWIILTLTVIISIGIFVWYWNQLRVYESPVNVSRIGHVLLKSQSDYDNAAPGRKGIRSYLQTLKSQGIPDNQLCLTNFYISSVNCAGIFTPQVDSIVTPNAIKTAYDGGARAFIFDIWPDLTPGANFAPVVQIVESGSLWRRISLNSLPFAVCLQMLKQTAFEIGSSPGSEDPIILYIRFRGKPRTTTYTATALALQANIEPYRLPTTFNNCRAQDDIFKMPITDLFKKIIVVSNVRASGNMLSDYINIGPKDGIQMEWTPKQANGLGVDAKADAIRKIQQNITFVAPLSESPEASNNYNVQPSYDIGIHCCAMNFWNRKMLPTLFEKQSFSLKPESLRYIVEVLPPPKYPQNPNWGSGTTAGTPTAPPSIRLP
jgi:hypothetical protein